MLFKPSPFHTSEIPCFDVFIQDRRIGEVSFLGVQHNPECSEKWIATDINDEVVLKSRPVTRYFDSRQEAGKARADRPLPAISPLTVAATVGGDEQETPIISAILLFHYNNP